MLTFKPGVGLRGLQPQMLLALEVVHQEFSKWGLETVVTSVNDSHHMEGSKHFQGAAMDFRTKHAAGLAKSITATLKGKLALLGFDVIFESEGLPNEHLHIEYDPKD